MTASRGSLRLLGACLVSLLALLAPASALGAHPAPPPVLSHGDPAVAFTPSAPIPEPRFPGIPDTWCGTPRSTDDVNNESGSLTDAKVHIVYAHPSDVASRFSTLDDVIQKDIEAIVDRIDAQTGSAKSIRFDLGTDGGTGCVDITSLTLPRTESAYDSGTFGKIVEDVAASFPGFSTSPGSTLPENPRNLMIYADVDPPGTVQGTAHQYGEDSEAGGFHNLGGLMGVVYDQAAVFTDATAAGIEKRRVAVLHETGHLLGAVQGILPEDDDPPNGSSASHCFEEWDVMCYDDGSPFALTYVCGTEVAPVPELFDCSQNDYFDPTETAGTYLDTHWNLYDSPFMCAVTPPTMCASDDVAPSRTLDVSVTPTGSGHVGASPGGISCPMDCSHLYVNGEMITLTPTAATGFTFEGWSGACTGTGACTVTMDADKTVTATFTAVPKTLTVSTVGSGMVTGTGISCPGDCVEDYAHGTSVPLTAAPAAGSILGAWSGACTGTGGCTVIMDGDKAVTATFTADTPSPPPPGGGGGTVTPSPAPQTDSAPPPFKKKKKKRKKKRKRK
jgi:uncharacterized repeat protein (TIGR02543 family)